MNKIQNHKCLNKLLLGSFELRCTGATGWSILYSFCGFFFFFLVICAPLLCFPCSIVAAHIARCCHSFCSHPTSWAEHTSESMRSRVKLPVSAPRFGHYLTVPHRSQSASLPLIPVPRTWAGPYQSQWPIGRASVIKKWGASSFR